jgi:uncharacterized repeat protein (TIGR01451 family)
MWTIYRRPSMNEVPAMSTAFHRLCKAIIVASASAFMALFGGSVAYAGLVDSADMEIITNASDISPEVGAPFSYAVGATDLGPADATGVVITDPVPAGVSITDVNVSQGTYDRVTGVWTVGTVVHGTRADLIIEATRTTASQIDNAASLTASTTSDPFSGNNVAGFTLPAINADLEVAQTVDPSSPDVGATASFTIKLINHGPNIANGVVVADPLPPELTFVSAGVGQGTYDAATGAWSAGTLAVGDSTTLVITAKRTTGSAITNVASRTASTPVDLSSIDDKATTTIPAIAADLALSATVNSPTPDLATAVSFTVTVANHGPNGATDVAVSDPLPAGLTFVSAAPDVGTYDAASGVWNVGVLASGANATVIIVATRSSAAALTNTATLSASAPVDPVPANDFASVALAPVSADLELNKTVSDTNPGVGGTVALSLNLSNKGPNTATDVVVSNPLPSGLTFASAAAGQGTYDSATGVWSVGNLAAGTSVTLVITATRTGEAPLPDTATGGSSHTSDANATNESPSVTFETGGPVDSPSASGPATTAARAAAPVPATARKAVGTDLAPIGFILAGVGLVLVGAGTIGLIALRRRQGLA